jgi:hypothetical protein
MYISILFGNHLDYNVLKRLEEVLMQSKSKESTFVLIMGLIGIAGVFLTLISDFILIGRPNSSLSFFKLGTESMAGLSQWRITIGAFLGVVVIPFQIAGLVTIYYAIRPAGKVKSLIIILINAHTLMMAVAFHISYAYIAGGWNLYYEIGYGDIVAARMLDRFDYYWKIIIIIMGVELIVSSAYLVFIILSKRSLYPRWMALFSPICVLVYIYPIILVIPKPIGGFIAPAFLNLSTLVFMILSTSIVYKKLKLNIEINS